MSWILWAQIASLIVTAGVMTRHALEANKRTSVLAVTGQAEIEVKTK